MSNDSKPVQRSRRIRSDTEIIALLKERRTSAVRKHKPVKSKPVKATLFKGERKTSELTEPVSKTSRKRKPRDYRDYKVVSIDDATRNWKWSMSKIRVVYIDDEQWLVHRDPRGQKRRTRVKYYLATECMIGNSPLADLIDKIEPRHERIIRREHLRAVNGTVNDRSVPRSKCER